MSVGTVSRTVVFAFAALHIALFAAQLRVFPLWGPFATFDEQLQYYQAGRNFSDYGFAPTAWLPDLSTASDRARHPLLYNHQPPGPQLLLGVLIRLIGERYDLIRGVFVALFCLGLWSYFQFCRLLDIAGLYGATAALLLVSPRTLLHMMDHPAYSLFPLFAFLPLVLLAHYRCGRDWWRRVTAIALVFVGTNYLIYGPMLMVFTFWAVGAVTRVVPLTRRDLFAFGAAGMLAVAMHLLQTAVLVGTLVMLRETAYTIANRMFGHPSRDELETFYRSLGFVLYGEHQFSALRVLAAIGHSVVFSGIVLVVIGLTAAIVAGRRNRVATKQASAGAARLLALASTITPALLVPSLAFPAFASDYGLHGTSEFLLALLAASGYVLARRFVEHWALARRRTVCAILAVGIGVAVVAQVVDVARVIRRTVRWSQQPTIELGLAWVSQHLQGQAAMTNIDPIALGFLTRELAFGGCHETALRDRPDPSGCAIRFGKYSVPGGYPPVAIYVWVGVGNAFCRPGSCLDRTDLERQYYGLFSEDLFAVYDLTVTRGARSPDATNFLPPASPRVSPELATNRTS